MDGSAGRRLFGVPGLADVLGPDGPVGAVAASVLGGAARPVRAILFDKTARTNWSLAWHQDRVIAVQRRMDVEGFGPWSRKHGALHVAPPPPPPPPPAPRAAGGGAPPPRDDLPG